MQNLPDLAYGPLPHQRLDLYLPAQAPKAIVAYAHGGGFVKGRRKEATVGHLAGALCPLGIAVASISYRLGGTSDDLPAKDQRAVGRMMRASRAAGLSLRPRLYGPAFVSALFDLSRALRALRDPSIAPLPAPCPIVLLGMSAGGIAALSLAHPPQVWVRRLDRPDAVLAVSAAMVQPWCLRAGAPPCVMLHGATDRIIPPQDATLAADRAVARGADLRLVLSPIPGHVQQLTYLLHGTAPEDRPALSLLTDLVDKILPRDAS